jgi:hypothetical protein
VGLEAAGWTAEHRSGTTSSGKRMFVGPAIDLTPWADAS